MMHGFLKSKNEVYSRKKDIGHPMSIQYVCVIWMFLDVLTVNVIPIKI